MGVRIYYNKYLNIPYPDRDRFEEFIRYCTVKELWSMLQSNGIYIMENKGALPLNVSEIDAWDLDKLIRVRSLGYSFILDYDPNIKKNGIAIGTLFRMFDYGSVASGLPKPVFYPIFIYIRDHIGEYYLKYLGAVK